jgi:hypothetical protein
MTEISDAKQAGYEAGRRDATRTLAEIIKFASSDEQEVKTKLRELLTPHTPQERRKILKGLRREMNAKNREIKEKRASYQQDIDRVNNMEASFLEVNDWADTAKFVLEKPSGSALHQLRQDIADNKAHVFHKREAFYGQPDDYEHEVFEESQVFVVEHDWASAFANAGDYEEGTEFHLPFDVCIFEFNVSGRRVAMITTEMDGVIYYETAAKSNIGWFLLGWAVPLEKLPQGGGADGWTKLVNFLAPQVKAICVALEAEVAETEVTRAPHKLNRAREKMGRIALSDYHIISLAHRRRYPQLPSSPSDEPKTQKRLHFRRGHWRHFEAFKTWVRWTLVGNPDLGFVDKDYRL